MDMLCVCGGGVLPGWRAKSGVGNYNDQSPKQGSIRFNSLTKTIHFAHLGILFIYVNMYLSCVLLLLAMRNSTS